MRASGQQAGEALAHALDAVDPRCAGSRPGRRASARAAPASRISPSDQAATKVLIASRFSGAVAITEKSRIPSSDSASVRGIGVAVRVRTSTSARRRFSASLWRTPEAVLLVDDHQPERRELHVPGEQLVRADDDVDFAPEASCWTIWFASLELLKRDSSGDPHRPVGEAIGKGLKMLLGEQRRRAEHGDPACGRRWRRTRPATRPRSCRSPRRRTPADPSACRRPCRRSPASIAAA